MSAVSLPRLYIQGHVYWNPSTFNNNDDFPTYDPVNVRLNWPWLKAQGINTPAEFNAWAIKLKESKEAGVTAPPSEWNYLGGNEHDFVSGNQPRIEWPAKYSKPSPTTITGFTGLDGTYSGSGDPWVGLPISLNAGDAPAKLVDVDPISFWSSQIFLDSITVGNASAGVSGKVAARAHERWINLARNYKVTGDLVIAGAMSCTWQTCMPTSTLVFNGSAAKGSYQEQLQAALAGPDVLGLMFRYQTYLTLYFQGDAFANLPPGQLNPRFAEQTALYHEYFAALADFQSGKTAARPPAPVNRAYSSTVGWLGLWKKGELVSMPGGRLLVPSGAVAPSNLPASYYTIPSGQTSMPASVPLGPAVVDVATDRATGMVERLTVDLGNTFPEIDSQLTKADFGTVTLGIVPVDNPSATPTALGTLAYDQAAYQQTAGLVDLTPAGLTAAQLGSSLFTITVDSIAAPGDKPAPAVAMVETPYTAATDDRGVYVEQPGAPWAPSAPAPTCTVQVRYLGGAPPAGTTLAVAQYQPSPANFNTSQLSLATGADASTMPSVTLTAGTPIVSNGQAVPVTVASGDDFGTVTLSFASLRPGMPTVVFSPIAPGGSVPAAPAVIQLGAFTTLEYAVVRALPFDNDLAQEMEELLQSGPPLVVVNAHVFETVFGLYHLLFPTMAFLSDPLTFQAWRGRILTVTDPAIRTSARYMPVMRQMSAGKRRILELWDRYVSEPAVRPVTSPPRFR